MSNYAYIRSYEKVRCDEVRRQSNCFKTIKIDKIYKDVNVSGVVLDRRGLTNLIIEAKQGDKIYICDISRLATNTIDAINLVNFLHTRGVDVFSLDEPTVNLYRRHLQIFKTLFQIVLEEYKESK